MGIWAFLATNTQSSLPPVLPSHLALLPGQSTLGLLLNDAMAVGFRSTFPHVENCEQLWAFTPGHLPIEKCTNRSEPNTVGRWFLS